MNHSPRLLLILLIALLSVNAGCSASNADLEEKNHSHAITPKAYTDDNGNQKAPVQTAEYSPEKAAYYGGYYERCGLGLYFDLSRWNQSELNAASFIHASPVYFYFDKSTLTPSTKEVLRQKADRLKSMPQLHLLLAGHSDERGSDAYNMRLGERRAKAVYDYLISLGVPSKQLATVSYGKRFPASAEKTEDGWSKNRRVEFMVSKP